MKYCLPEGCVFDKSIHPSGNIFAIFFYLFCTPFAVGVALTLIGGWKKMQK
jgi:hypothetical protein